MTRLRFSIAQLMAVVLFVGFGFAAWRNADENWASAAYTLAFLMISVAPLCALARIGRARMAWAGFAIFGWSRLLVGALPLTNSSVFGPTPSPGLLGERVLTHALPYFLPPGGYTSFHAQVFLSLDIIVFGWIGAILCRLITGKDERPNP